MSLSPNHFEALMHRAIASRDAGHFEAALADFNQAIAFESWDNGQNLMLHGIAGTGKTFLALYFASAKSYPSSR